MPNLFQRLMKRIINRRYASMIEVERAEQHFYLDYLRPGMTVFDVGANVGELTMLFSRLVEQSGRVYSFEASRTTFESLQSVCKAASLDNVTLIQAAVTDQKGIVRLNVYPSGYGSWNSLADRPLENYGVNIKPIGIEDVTAITIDSYCSEHHIQTVDLLKIDVEGAEHQVLLGSQYMLQSKRVKCCIFEFGQTTFDMGNNPKMISYYLNKLGYKIKNIVKGDPIFPGGANVTSSRFAMMIAEPK